MADSDSRNGHYLTEAEVLTLPEVAAFLRVPEERVLELANRGQLPAQKVGEEWRFLKRAIVEWLTAGAEFFERRRHFPPPWLFDFPYRWEERFEAFEQRVLTKISASKRPGSKEAVLKHFGVFKDDADLDDQLAALRARRGASGK